MIFDELQHEAYIARAGSRGIKLDNNEFGRLADVLYYECRWEAFQIRSRLKHYEGWDQHEWA